MNKKAEVGGWIFLLIVILIWGFIGGTAVESPRYVCSTGLELGEDTELCWIWNKTQMGEFEDFLDNFSGGVR